MYFEFIYLFIYLLKFGQTYLILVIPEGMRVNMLNVWTYYLLIKYVLEDKRVNVFRVWTDIQGVS